ncbi:hypothetical protein PN498_11190 [Oscillatoria sp. CS-180]|uniref:hypothetical protein n=1 Tax=Oscillatoria sp. CS-180 TaxID=3021720 RepID=UPI00232E2472|nr:hypothetical protein [Oscillatoria sp. CS-180]MDB9526556.1 hypothetical protein [Oscillatoria sp. CS-180]
MPFKGLLRNVGLLSITFALVGLSAWFLPSQAQLPEVATPPNETPAERVNAYLADARVEEGAIALAIELAVDSQNDDLRFATGFLQFTNAVENLGQSWYEYGLRSQSGLNQFLPFLRIPIPQNLDPTPLSNQQFRQILEQFIEDVSLAEETLSAITNDTAQLGIYLGRAYFDFDTDGEKSPDESLWRIYSGITRQTEITEEQAADFLINLDAGDVRWLRGYCHLMTAVLDFYLAHDDSRLFERVAHLFFVNPELPYEFLVNPNAQEVQFDSFLDAIALIHLINFPVIDSQRTESARDHLLQVIDLSRQTWDFYLQETDDDHEWIPNPNQTGVIPGVEVTQEMVDQWIAFLDEADSILAGDLLLPFWRGSEPVGVNLRRVLVEPQTFDIVLWFQGTAADPYLETGNITDPDFWWRLFDAFNGQFVSFALWFN